MGITRILRSIWLFSANKIKSSGFFSKQPAQLIVKLNPSLRQHIIVTVVSLAFSGIHRSFIRLMDFSGAILNQNVSIDF